MKNEKEIKTLKALVTLLVLVAAITFTSCSGKSQEKKIKSLQAELDKYKADEALQNKRIAIFDTLDFELYSNQKWNLFNRSHAGNIKVYYPDGSITTGLYPQHIDKLTPLFVFAPDTKITEHPIKFGRGDWTCVVGTLEGTFSKPMPVGNGKTIPPTNKKFKISMTTLGHWGADGKMIEEYLFLDNQSLLKQIGLVQ